MRQRGLRQPVPALLPEPEPRPARPRHSPERQRRLRAG
ncbi:hypothetical protein P355_0832 [Burkholderia cenocepacia KC-01]|nr:hypothetical protein P355_0832 [Burkholderia cenocepacia KC-01]